MRNRLSNVSLFDNLYKNSNLNSKEPINRQEYFMANIKNCLIEKDVQAKSNTIFTAHFNSQLDQPRVLCLNHWKLCGTILQNQKE